MQISNEDYEQFKPLLFSIAYRMLGSIVEAEDVVQETFLKAYQVNEQQVVNKKAYLCKMVTNRCLDELKSVRLKREQYIGPWNPEPLLFGKIDRTDPSEMLLQKEGISIAFLRMMEHLAPDERAVLLLREVFEFSYEEIANFIEKKEDNCRKILSRAKQKILRIENESLAYEENKSLINRFIHAFQSQNTETILKLITEDVTLFSDGGGKINAAIRPILSRAHVLSYLYGVIKKAPEGVYFDIENVNYQPAIVFYLDGKVHSILSFYICHNQINEMYLTLNPDKLPLL